MRRGVVLVVATLVASLLPLAAAVRAQEGFPVSIRPEIQENTAARGGQRILVSGSAPGTTIESAGLTAVEVDGTRTRVAIHPSHLNRTPGPVLDTEDYLRVREDGTLEGRLTLPPCPFASPTNSCFHGEVRSGILDVVVAGQTGVSNALRIDYVRPSLRPVRELIAPDRVLVRFSEPVRNPDGELGPDWRVNGDPVTRVEVASAGHPDCVYLPDEDATAGATGCTRILHLSEPLHEDAEPDVEYWLIGSTVPERSEHFDYASNQVLFRSTAPRIAPALDLIRPAAPNIESIAGKPASSGSVTANNPAPAVRLTNMTEGHTARVTVVGASGSSTHEAVVPTGANAVDVPVSLPADGTYTVSALAVDPNGNISTETAKTAPRADGTVRSATYLLDTVAPQILTARLASLRSVEVQFSEPVDPAGNAGRWFVGDVPVTAEGSGDRRTLRASIDLTNPGPVRWEPTSDQPGSPGRYGDRAGNGLAAFTGLPLSDLPAIPAPSVTVPPQELYTRSSTATVAGTAPSQANLVADLFDRGAETPRGSAPVSDGRWSLDVPLDADRRYELEVRLRDTQTGVTSPRVPVPDIVRDTAAPIVDVLYPDPKPLDVTNPTEQRRTFGVGGSVPVRWSATDEAPGDTERPDHGSTADITLISGTGAEATRRVVAQGIPHQPGQEQTYSYTLTEADLAGQASRELRFEVAVNDLAGNRGTDQSAPILLRADFISFRAHVVEPRTIDVFFPIALTGETLPGEWFVDDAPAQQTQKQTRDEATVIRLTVVQMDDPNATPMVEYRPLPLNVSPLRSAAGAQVTPQEVQAEDRIAPTLTATAPGTGPRPLDADTVPFSGTTDESARPNTILAFRTDAAGAPQGAPIASVTAGTDGQWRLSVPLAQDATNRIVVRASDPSGNVSTRLPNPPYTVVEDSTAPVVRLVAPASADLVAPVLLIRWQTLDAHPEEARVEYRVAGSDQWTIVADRITDAGSYEWHIPQDVQRQIFSVRVTATDQTGKTGEATADGLRLDLQAPTLVKARASGAQVVDVTFSEPVTVDGSGFTIGGATVRRMKGEGLTRTFILNRAVDSTTPEVTYAGTSVRDVAGNAMENATIRATRAFAFAVTGLKAARSTVSTVRLSWADTRNRAGDLRGYRVYRDGAPVVLVGASTRAYVDRSGKGAHVYTVRAVDDRRRVSSVRRVSIR